MQRIRAARAFAVLATAALILLAAAGGLPGWVPAVGVLAVLLV